MANPQLLNQLQQMKAAGQFPNFIDYIRFPKFRNLEANARIEFEHPITVFVGQNGCGKSSALQALFGAPVGKSTGSYWFETSLDRIDQRGDDRHCFIYSYNGSGANGEVLKTRIMTAGRPERWDTSESLEKYGMISPGQRLAPPVEKSVVYLNFRNAQNAFEKAFNEERPPATGIQDYLRKRCADLARVLGGRGPGSGYTKRTHDQPVELTAQELMEVSTILGRNYQGAQLIRHRFFKMWGYSVRIRNDFGEYTEAFAGSGESAVVLLVYEISRTPPGSLLLLDEPETSLHPGAQALVQDFILRACRNGRHQVVICTHSPEIVRGLPASAVKVFTPSPERKFRILPNVVPAEAFFFLGRSLGKPGVIIVEDKLAKKMVLAVLNTLGEHTRNLFEVRFNPGGHNTMKQDAIYAARDGLNYWYLFDGDALEPCPFAGDPLAILPGDHVQNPDLGFPVFLEALQNWLGGGLSFTADGLNPNAVKLQAAAHYASFAKMRFSCFPAHGADTAIWDDMTAGQIATAVLGSNEAAGNLMQMINGLGSSKEKFAAFSEALVASSQGQTIETIHQLFVTNWVNRATPDKNAILEFIEIARQSCE